MEKKGNKKSQKAPREYVTGTARFMGLTLFCTPDTLIPREETELLTKAALENIHELQRSQDELNIIDMGTGSGNICVALAVNSDRTRFFASDLSPQAVEVAKKNAKKYNVDDRISFFTGDLFDPFKKKMYQEKFDMVVCNPPYIPTSSLSKMDPAITEFEPIMALDAGVYGIDFFRRLIKDALGVLRSEGVLIFEIGEGQEKLVTRLIKRNSEYGELKYYYDDDKIRVVHTTKK
jgi:release factor glutamine methyltransferase